MNFSVPFLVLSVLFPTHSLVVSFSSLSCPDFSINIFTVYFSLCAWLFLSRIFFFYILAALYFSWFPQRGSVAPALASLLPDFFLVIISRFHSIRLSWDTDFSSPLPRSGNRYFESYVALITWLTFILLAPARHLHSLRSTGVVCLYYIFLFLMFRGVLSSASRSCFSLPASIWLTVWFCFHFIYLFYFRVLKCVVFPWCCSNPPRNIAQLHQMLIRSFSCLFGVFKKVLSSASFKEVLVRISPSPRLPYSFFFFFILGAKFPASSLLTYLCSCSVLTLLSFSRFLRRLIFLFAVFFGDVRIITLPLFTVTPRLSIFPHLFSIVYINERNADWMRTKMSNKRQCRKLCNIKIIKKTGEWNALGAVLRLNVPLPSL